MRFGSVCSGIEAASVAFHPLGMQAAWLAEVDKSASAVLAYRFPDVPNLGDMTKIAVQIDLGLVEAPDMLVGGTPCQAFSVAGRREGLADPRGQLTLSFVEIADAIDRTRRAAGFDPCIILWENVPGCLSDKTNAFGNFLAALAGEDVPLEPTGKRWSDAGVVVGPERTIAWRILDAQFFGLAQRRKRVFVVASARDGFDPGEVLLEFDGVRRDSPPSREKREDSTHPLAPCLTGSGRGIERTGDTRGQDPVVAVSEGHRITNRVSQSGFDQTVGTLCADTHPGAYSGQDAYTGRIVPVECVTGDITHCLKADGFDASEDDTGRGQPIIPTLRTHRFTCRSCSMKYGIDDYERNPTCPLCGSMDCDDALESDDEIICVHGSQDPIHSRHLANALGRNNGLENVVAFSAKDHGADATNDLAPTLRAGGHSESHANGGVMPAVAYSVALRGREGGATAELGDDVATCLRTGGGGGDKPHVLAPAYAIQERAVCENPNAGPDGMGVRTDDCAYTLEARSVPQAVAHVPFDTTQLTHPANYSNPQIGDPCHPLAAGAHAPAVAAFSIMPMNSCKDYKARPTDISQPLMAGGPTTGNQGGDFLVEPTMAVRRLMPVECERLQGFPDGWTRIPVRFYRTKQVSSTRPEDMWEVGFGPNNQPGWWLMAADGPRYKQLGNSMAVSVMAWIGRRIQNHLNEQAVRSLIG